MRGDAARTGRLTALVPRTGFPLTISRLAEMLGEDEEWLDEISIVPDLEDRRLGVLDSVKKR